MSEEIYAVILPKANDDVTEAVRNAYADDYTRDFHRLAPNVFLIRTADRPGDVRTKLGIGRHEEQEPQLGMVFSLNGLYSGLYFNDAWEWLGIRKRA